MLQQYKDTVNSFRTAEEFDTWLLTLSQSIPVETSKEIRLRSNLVRGCEIQTWLDVTKTEDGYYLRYDSDSAMNRSLAKIIVDICNSQDINTLQFYDLNDITQFLTVNKKKGMQLMLNKLRKVAG